MSEVRATIQLLVDFHGHLKETDKLQALSAATRKTFLKTCAQALHGLDISRFITLTNGPEFNPLLTLDATGHPTPAEITTKLQDALDAYNGADFPLQLKIDAGMMQEAGAFTCVRWVWQNGQWVAIYNYSLMAENVDEPKQGELQARYHVSLTYPRSIVDVGT